MSENMDNRFSILLGAHRKKISEVSRETGISRATLTNLYYGRGKAISYAVITKLCEYFGCSANEIIDIKIKEEN